MLQPTTLLADPSLGFPRARIGAGRWASARPRPRTVKVSWRWFAVVAALFVAFAGLAFLRVWPPLATVMSASMAPTIDTGDMVVLQRLDRAAHVGDIVVVNVPDDARSRYGYPPVVIHRIVRIAADGTVSTKGDARKEPDPFTVPRRAISAHVIGRIPAGGRVLAFLTSPLGLLWLGGGALFLVGLPLLERKRDGQQTVAGELQQLRAEREAADERCDILSQELRQVTQAFTAQLAALPAQLEAAVAAAVSAQPAATVAAPAIPAPRAIPPVAFVAAEAWSTAELPFPEALPPIAFVAAAAWAKAELPFPEALPPIAFVAAAAWAKAELPFPQAPPSIAFVAAAAWAKAELPFPQAPPPIAAVAAAAWTEVELPFPQAPPPIAAVAAEAWANAALPFPAARVAVAVPVTPVPPIAFVAAVVPAARAVVAWADADPLDQLELALFAVPRSAVPVDASEDQLAFALDVERAPRFVRPSDDQLAFALEASAANPDQLVISTPPPSRWDTPPPSVVVRRRTGGLVGRALSLLAA